jgi:hypothetical protein
VENGRKRRTRLALRNRFFLYALAVLAPLVVILAAFMHAVGELSWPEIALVAVAGGVGGTVSGTLKLRGTAQPPAGQPGQPGLAGRVGAGSPS